MAAPARPLACRPREQRAPGTPTVQFRAQRGSASACPAICRRPEPGATEWSLRRGLNERAQRASSPAKAGEAERSQPRSGRGAAGAVGESKPPAAEYNPLYRGKGAKRQGNNQREPPNARKRGVSVANEPKEGGDKRAKRARQPAANSRDTHPWGWRSLARERSERADEYLYNN